MKHFTISAKNNIGTVHFDLLGEKVNKFNREVMSEFKELIDQLKTRKDFEAVILFSGKPGNFIAGADIQLIQSAKTAEDAIELARAGQNLLNDWEDLPMPTIVAINGTCMGGGCELSLASAAIVMSSDPAAKRALLICWAISCA